ncbi:MAG: hypothetical protein QM790_13180 [Nibricoccus sp.]
MRRPFVSTGILIGSARGLRSLAKSRELPLQAHDVFGHFEHYFVLLDNMSLEPGEAFFQPSNLLLLIHA